MTKPQLKIRIPYADDIALGPGKVDLLEAIQDKGSISGAAKSMSMSYKRAWDLINTMNTSFKQPLVITTTGGKHGGGAQVSELGIGVISQYRSMERTAQQAIEQEATQLISLLKNL
jgi:molybdate transport system regulatory protein